MESRRTISFLIGGAFLLSIFLFGCQKNEISPGVDQVSIASFQFNPSSMTVSIGTTITWTNNDSTTHTVTSVVAGLFDSGNLTPNQTFSHTFNNAGTFQYHCKIHTSMTATIIVQ